ncbi:hypothetical protein SDC9_190207 [bioreactor metagenome]|uniref:Uncharacterized protein n=1 Tax=bioreactor metagenome TaxID=1076179 RepID=A0A645HUW9_9ZZZZ
MVTGHDQANLRRHGLAQPGYQDVDAGQLPQPLPRTHAALMARVVELALVEVAERPLPRRHRVHGQIHPARLVGLVGDRQERRAA